MFKTSRNFIIFKLKQFLSNQYLTVSDAIQSCKSKVKNMSYCPFCDLKFPFVISPGGVVDKIEPPY